MAPFVEASMCSPNVIHLKGVTILEDRKAANLKTSFGMPGVPFHRTYTSCTHQHLEVHNNGPPSYVSMLTAPNMYLWAEYSITHNEPRIMDDLPRDKYHTS